MRRVAGQAAKIPEIQGLEGVSVQRRRVRWCEMGLMGATFLPPNIHT